MTSKKHTRILSIDGGGIRGIIPGQILVALEEKLKVKTKNPNARIADFFDLIAGTSTGGILTCAYLCPHPDDPLRPKFNAQEVVNLYLNRGHEIFSVPLWHKIRTFDGVLDEKYPSAEIEKALKKYFGKVKLSQLLKPCLITSYDIYRRVAHFFTQHDAKNKTGYDFLVKDVARATSAAPTYFECANTMSLTGISYPLIDGGVFANNPALCAYAEVQHEFHAKTEDIIMLSIGTGFSKNEIEYKNAKKFGLVDWAKPLINIMMSGVSQTVDYQLRQIFDAVGAPNHYMRMDVEIPKGVNTAMDDATPENLLALKELGTKTAEDADDKLNDFMQLLI
jgi:uncharacterized protein